jgi:hypothetical protein
MKTSQKAIVTATACLAIGATAGIVGSAAAPSSSGKAKRPEAQRFLHREFHRGPFGRGFHGGGGPAVHATVVVLNKAGTGFVTVTEDSGKVKSVAGNDVTITEGFGKVTYKDVTVALPGNATIYRNGKKAAVGDLTAGDFIHVSSSSEGTWVMAADKSFRPFREGRFRGGRPGMRGGPKGFRGGPPALRGAPPPVPPGI